MKRLGLYYILVLLGLVMFFLACRTATLLTGGEPTVTRARATRAALRPTFTPIPPATDTPPPTETPEPTQPPPPTEEPTNTQVPTRRPTLKPKPTNTNIPPPPVPTVQPTSTRVFEWGLNGTQSCKEGGNNESAISGKITANGSAARGQKVQASSGPGGEPISENPAESDNKGNYKVTFVCGGKACNGDFYIWIINNEKQQVSPFVKFHFDTGCRLGTQNFVKR